MKNYLRNSTLAFVALFLLSIVACRKDEGLYVSKPTELYEAKIAHDWSDMMRELTKKTAGIINYYPKVI